VGVDPSDNAGETVDFFLVGIKKVL
jgi:hypothetical protein